ncbi:hypothetical protein [Chitinimonas sp. BJYL2]|uniref:hypothetical protein n=1 Tax=Chitinimonas sp. BJYL2 TaxID=2976696 RepID=UPI0022B400BE|nr:hypothetical protein [Chitinimonas sp. BJYL2]
MNPTPLTPHKPASTVSQSSHFQPATLYRPPSKRRSQWLIASGLILLVVIVVLFMQGSGLV